MSGSTEQLGKKISGAKDLGGVVRAMKAPAASSVGQYEGAVEALDDYLKTVELGLIAVCTAAARGSGRRRQAKARTSDGAVIFGSDQGLVGKFNEVIVEFSLQALRALPGRVTQIWVVGERAKTLLVKTEATPVRGLEVPGSLDAITPLVGQILLELQAARQKARSGRLMSFTITRKPAQPTSPWPGVFFRWTPPGKKSFAPRHGRRRRLRR